MKYVHRDPEDIEILKAQTTLFGILHDFHELKFYRKYIQDSSISSVPPKYSSQLIRVKTSATAMVGLGNNGSA